MMFIDQTISRSEGVAAGKALLTSLAQPAEFGLEFKGVPAAPAFNSAPEANGLPAATAVRTWKDWLLQVLWSAVLFLVWAALSVPLFFWAMTEPLP